VLSASVDDVSAPVVSVPASAVPVPVELLLLPESLLPHAHKSIALAAAHARITVIFFMFVFLPEIHTQSSYITFVVRQSRKLVSSLASA
jgi:hypothetical protein